MSKDEDLIAAFIAKKGITKVEAGVRAMDEKEIHILAHGTDRQREKLATMRPDRDGYAEFEKAQQEAWLARYEGWKRE